MPQFIKTEALVLHATRWRESSKIIHLFSETHGCIGVVAKGALRPKSPFRGVLETLNHVEIVLSHREGRDLQTLTAATLLNAFQHTRDDLPKTAGAFAAAELLHQLFRSHEPVAGFFRFTIDWLQSLNDSRQVESMGYLWHFIFEMSRILGFGWQLSNCPQTGNPPDQFPVQLDYREGTLICAGQRSAHLGQTVSLNQQAWQQLAALAECTIDALPEVTNSRHFSRHPDITATLLSHLEHHTESRITLKSLNWYV